jgi:hypothetical protein
MAVVRAPERPVTAPLRRLAPLLALAALVILVRAVLVGGFGHALPFWDQWDAEASTWLKPWVQGELTFAHLLAAHNEHRIAYSRLWSLLWFEANAGHWDNLVLALANTLLSGLLAALTYGLLRSGLATRRARGLFFVLVLLLAVIPFGWENLLVGFQSQFQFLALFALLLLAAAAHLRDRKAALPVVWGLALLGLPTMATGVLAPVAAGGVLVLRAWTREWRRGPAAVAVAGLAAISLAGLAFVPMVPHHQGMHPESLAEGLRALGRVLAWPVPRGWWAVPAIWLPTFAFFWRLCRERRASAAEWIAIGLAGWVVLQALAITWSRGQGLDMPPSRYTDLLALGVVANGWLALRACESALLSGASPRRPRWIAIGLAALFFTATGLGLGRGLPTHGEAMRERSWFSEEQRANVREFITSGDPQALVVPPLYIPYPHAHMLAGFLSDPVIRAMLPATVTDGEAGPLGRAAGRWRDAMRPRFHSTVPGHPVQVRRWRLPVLDGPAEALQVVEGVTVTLDFTVPRSGHLGSVALQLGTYGQQLPGTLVLEVCRGGDCVGASSPLALAMDNKDHVLLLERPLPVQAGDPLHLVIGARGTGHPVAVWLAPAPADASALSVVTVEGPRPDLARYRPRLVLGLLP